MTRIEDVQLDKIDIYGGTQTRMATNDEAISAYAEEMDAGTEFPPIVLFYDGAKYWLADGFHRYLARMRLKRATIRAEVHDGGRSDALLSALGANATNGLYRTNADKRNSVEIALEEWPDRSNAVLAEICKVSIDLVRKCRGELEKLNRIDEPKHVIGKDGKSYPNKIEREPRGKTEKRSSDSESGGGGGGGKPKKGKGDSAGFGGSNMEIEADARKMIREGEMDPAELSNIHSATGFDYAAAAIKVLERMPAELPKRQEGLEMVRRWLETSSQRGMPRIPSDLVAALDRVGEPVAVHAGNGTATNGKGNVSFEDALNSTEIDSLTTSDNAYDRDEEE